MNTPNVTSEPYNIIGGEGMVDHPSYETNVNVVSPNDVPKTPMDGGYAGKAVLDVYIKDIKDVAAKNKWKKRNE